MDKRKIIIRYLLFMLLITTNCGKPEGYDEFYDKIGGWDWIRIPLIKPYHIIKIDPEIESNSWLVRFDKMNNTYNNVKKTDVKDSIIYVLAGKVDEKNDSVYVGTTTVATAWIIVDVKKNTEKVFDNVEDFNEEIKKNRYKQPQWLDVDSLSNALGHGAHVPWRQKKEKSVKKKSLSIKQRVKSVFRRIINKF